ncbi:MAG: ATP-binding protein [Lachnospiraceae bacterium]|nr:ATP-binding protein [Lachnospiraceae bacterium]MDE7201831.1 ATP-binding protein [Lachnospiraceae bacterium]
MDKFIGRRNELEALGRLYEKEGFQMMVLYGRRRVGKSTLIKEFIKGKRAIYYTASKTGIRNNLEKLGKQVLAEMAPELGALVFQDMDALFSFIGKRCMEERLVFVIDELPYLAEADDGVLSVIQNHIDGEWASGQMFLILCGSSISFMENEVLSEKSPVFGRRTAQIKLEPFSYMEAAEFVPAYSETDKAVCYGITGGIAKYLSLMDDSLSLDENIVNQFFTKSGYMYEETNNLLMQEFRNISTYNDIIEAVASGANKINEIADKTHIEPTTVSHALANLVVTGIVVKEYAITDEANKKKVQYKFKDNMFRFWYRFVPDAVGAIELGKGDVYYQNIVKNRISEYMGEVFEDMARYYTLKLGLCGELNCFVTSVGKWWGTNPRKHETTDIDIVGLDKQSKKAVLGECKYKNEPIDKKVYDALLEKNGLISGTYTVVQYLLFSKKGFSDWVMEQADQGLVKLISLQDMYRVSNR